MMETETEHRVPKFSVASELILPVLGTQWDLEVCHYVFQE